MARKKQRRRSRGTGSVFKRARSPYWYVRYRDARGRRVTESSGSEKRGDAERLLRERLSCVDRGGNPAPQTVTFDKLLEDMIADRERRGCRSKPLTKRLTEAFKGRRALTITGSAILAYETQRLKADGAARATVNQELATLRRMFNLGVENGLLSRDSVPRIKTPNPKNARKGFFERAELDAIVANLPDCAGRFSSDTTRVGG